MIYKVYVKINDKRLITNVNSSGFLSELTGWTQIDEGSGDKFYLAQGNYFPLPIYDERGICHYKLEDGQPVERTQEEMDEEYAARPAPPPSDKERITALEAALTAIEEGIASV